MSLRIGVILGDQLVEERLIRGREPVTIGQSVKNRFAIPLPELPRSWTLFSVDDGRYLLNIGEGMEARVADRAAGGGIVKRTGRCQVPLTDTTRGKVTVGDVTLLFQFVPTPPLAPRPQLPRSVRKGLADSIDPYLAVVLGVSIVFHGALFGYFKWWRDPPRELAPDEIPDQFARFTNEPAPLPLPAVDIAEEASEGGGQAEEATPDRAPKPRPKRDPVASSPEVSASERVANSAVVRVLGGAGGGSNSPFYRVTETGDFRADLEKALEKRDSVVLGPGGLGGGIRDGSAGGPIEERPAAPVVGPKGPVRTGHDRAEEELPVVAETEDVTGEPSGALNPEIFHDTLKKRWYVQMLQCYDRVAKLDPSAQGKVSVTLTVGIGGNVTDIEVNGFDSTLDACIESAARRSWRFPRPDQPSTFDFVVIFRQKK